MNRPTAVRALGALALLATTVFVPDPALGAATQSGAGPSGDRPTRVVLVSIPGLGFDDVDPTETPTLVSLADEGAVAALSVRTLDRRTEPAEAYATIGAGARTTAPPGEPGSGRGVDEELRSGRTAGEQLRSQGVDPGDAAIVVLGVDEVATANDGEHQGARIGALGRAVSEHGWQTAVVANHDGGGHPVDRTAALAVVDRQGRIDAGSVAPNLVATGSGGPRRTSVAALSAAVADLPAQDVVAVVEIGDVAWSELDRADGGGREGGAGRDAAVGRADDALAAVVDVLGPQDLVLVLAPTAPAGREQPTPFVLAGPGIRAGLAESATTRRAGYVTLPDVAATVLDQIGATVPASMNATPIESRERTTSGAARLAERADAVAEHRVVDRATGILLVTLPILFASWALLLVLVVRLPPGPATRPARTVVAWIGVTLALTPTVTYLLGALDVGAWGQPAWAALAWGSGAALAGALLHLGAGAPTRTVALVAAVVWTVPVVDLLLGGHLQFGSALGNSPTVAGRFSGIGNNAFALLTAGAILVATVAWQAVGARRSARAGLVAAAAVFAVTIVVDGAPGLGSDVGGVLTLVPVTVVALWTMAGRRISVGRAALAMVLGLVVLGVATAVDLSRPASSRTHLGRFARRLLDGDGGTEVIRRKADAALASFVQSSLVWVIVATAVLAALLWWQARPTLIRLLRRPAAQPVLTAGAVGAVLGCALNDSGVMVPAMMATVLVPLAAVLLLADLDRPRGGPPTARPGTEPRTRLDGPVQRAGT